MIFTLACLFAVAAPPPTIDLPEAEIEAAYHAAATQNVLAAVVHFVDEFVINCLLVGGLSRGVASVGQLCRRLQSGSLQGYAFAFGLGVVIVVWITVF